MKFRIAIGQISHETNFFSPIPTVMKDFEDCGLFRKDELLQCFSGTKTELGGFIDVLREGHVEILPILSASAIPSGPVGKRTFETLRDELVGGIKKVGKVHGVLLALHGAMVAEGYPDGEGEILRKIQEVVGDKVPVVCTLDLHATVTEAMIRYSSGLFAYDENPHVDQYERGVEAAQAMLAMLKGRIRPVMYLKRLSMCPPLTNMGTGDGPMKKIHSFKRKLEKKKGVINISVIAGFPYMDHKDMGFCIVAITDNDAALAERVAEILGELAWSVRKEFIVRLPSPKEAVLRALKAERGPILLADISDNINGGAPGDSTVILRTLMDMDVRNVALASIYDPEVVEEAIRIGVGKEIKTRLGGRTFKFHGNPIPMKAKIKVISDGEVINKGLTTGSGLFEGLTMNLGRTVRLKIFDIDVMVSEKRVPPISPDVFRSVGIEPIDKKILVIKTRGHYWPRFKIAREIIEVDAPGLVSPDLSRFSYKKMRRPMFPMDPI
jgi:microcystin degradation protein MlrC